MSQTIPAKPAEGEYANFYWGYIESVPDGDVMQQLSTQPARMDALLGKLSESDAMDRYAPGKWSVKEVVGHLSDTERVMSYRLLRIARSDATPLAGFDQDAYVPAAGSDARSMHDLLLEFRAVRASTIALARGLDANAWTRTGTVNNATASARALLYIIAGHAAHHMKTLREQYGIADAEPDASATG